MRDDIEVVIQLPTALLRRYLRISKRNGKSLNEELLTGLSYAIALKEKQKKPPDIFGLAGKGAETIRDSRQSFEESILRAVLDKNHWNISKSAKELGISRPTIYDMIARYKVKKTGKPSSGKLRPPQEDIA